MVKDNPLAIKVRKTVRVVKESFFWLNVIADMPWGYTPLEAVAFKVPCITTDLAGFGLWANTEKGKYSEIEDGVKVLQHLLVLLYLPKYIQHHLNTQLFDTLC